MRRKVVLTKDEYKACCQLRTAGWQTADRGRLDERRAEAERRLAEIEVERRKLAKSLDGFTPKGAR